MLLLLLNNALLLNRRDSSVLRLSSPAYSSLSHLVGVKVVVVTILLLYLLEQGRSCDLSLRKDGGRGLLQWSFFIGLPLGIRNDGTEGAVVGTRVEINLRPEIVLLLVYSTSNGKHVCLIILRYEKSRISILMVIIIVVNVINIRTLLSEISLVYSSSTKIKCLLGRYHIRSLSACLGAICGQIVQVEWGSSVWWLNLTIYTRLRYTSHSHSVWWKMASVRKSCS